MEPKNITDEQIQKLYHRCQKLGAAYSQEIGEDFPGWAVTQVIHRDYFIPIKWLLATYLRDKFGRLGFEGNESRKILNGFTSRHRQNSLAGEGGNPYRSAEKNLDAESKKETNLFEELRTLPEGELAKMDWEELLAFLPEKERAVRVLETKWGMTPSEIAHVMGWSPKTVTYYRDKGDKILSVLVRSGGLN